LRRKVWQSLIAGLAALVVQAAGAAGIDGVRVSDNGERTRAVFQLAGMPDYEVFRLSDPHRVVIDFADGELGADRLPASGVVERIRTGRQGDGTLRVVLDVARQVEPRSFVVGGGEAGGRRLFVDLAYSGGGGGEEQRVVHSAAERRGEAVVVAIDAGHGGADPGAVGANGTNEKRVVLEVARRLRDLMAETPGLEPLLTRDADRYMGLRERTRVAEEGGADVFLSVHADGSEDPHVKGASVYALSLDGATSEQARLLAQRENAAEPVGGVSLARQDEDLRKTVVDLYARSTIESSLDMGGYLLPELDRHADLLHDRVEQAGFAVLKSLDMPSLLVELGFITNPEEERRLRTDRYQQALAEGIVAGVREYADSHLREELELAGGGEGGRRKHEVQRGESLSGIAQRYQVSVGRLRAVNDLAGDRIRAGSTLVIP